MIITACARRVLLSLHPMAVPQWLSPNGCPPMAVPQGPSNGNRAYHLIDASAAGDGAQLWVDSINSLVLSDRRTFTG